MASERDALLRGPRTRAYPALAALLAAASAVLLFAARGPSLLRYELAGAAEPSEGETARIVRAGAAERAEDGLAALGAASTILWWAAFGVLAVVALLGARGLLADAEEEDAAEGTLEAGKPADVKLRSVILEAAVLSEGNWPLGSFSLAWLSPVANAKAIFVRSAGARGRKASFEALDGLRALAFLWVLLFHVQMYGLAFPGSWGVLSFVVGKGEAGVTVFLVLSGFLLAHVVWQLLEREKLAAGRAYLTFAWRRLGRIYPALLGGVALSQICISLARGEPWASACGAPASGFRGGGLRRVVLDATLALWNDDPKVFRFGCPAASSPWTVSLELQCYALTPPLVILFHRNRRLGGAAIAAATLGSLALRGARVAAYAGAALSAGAPLDHLGDVRSVYVALPARANEYMLGVLAYVAFLEEKRRPSKLGVEWRAKALEGALFASAAAVSVCWLVWWRGYWGGGGSIDVESSSEVRGAVLYIWLHFFLVALCTACACALFATEAYGKHLGFISQTLKAGLSTRCLFPVAALSYTSYLCQGIALNAALLRPWPGGPVARTAQVLVGAFATGLALSLAVERPCMKAFMALPVLKKGSADKRRGPGGALLLVAMVVAFGAMARRAPVRIPTPELLPPVFSDGMVLSADGARLFGSARPFSPVSAEVDGTRVATTRADGDGAWRADLPQMKRSPEPRTVQVRAGPGASRTLSDILFGDVFLCAGQSNMQLSVAETSEAAETLRHEYPAIRVATATRSSMWDHDSGKDFWLQPWARASNRTLVRSDGWPKPSRMRMAFSSACFHFGKSLMEAGVPAVGLIETDFPGSRLYEWSPATENGAFRKMVKPLAPLKLAGVAWYHGESYTDHYGRDLKRLIKDWRRAFEDPKLYFGVFQLGTQFAAEIREEQLEVLELENTAYAMTSDLGVGGFMDMHSVFKEPAARRLAKSVLNIFYGRDVPWRSPQFARRVSHRFEAERVTVTVALDHLRGPLEFRRPRNYVVQELVNASADEFSADPLRPTRYRDRPLACDQLAVGACAWPVVYVRGDGRECALNATVTNGPAAGTLDLVAAVPEPCAGFELAGTSYGWGLIPLLAAYDAATDLPVAPWMDFAPGGEDVAYTGSIPAITAHELKLSEVAAYPPRAAPAAIDPFWHGYEMGIENRDGI